MILLLLTIDAECSKFYIRYDDKGIIQNSGTMVS